MKRLPLPYKAIFLFTAALYVSVYAQYFGRNKVQYQNFHFSVLKTSHFSILYYPEELSAVKDAARMLERWCNREERLFDLPLPNDQPVILYANHADFQQTNAVGELIPEGTGGVTEGFMNRIIIPLTGVFSDNDHVLGHELTHAFQYTMMKNTESSLSGGQQIPLWFTEGMAEYVSGGSFDPLTAMWMRDAVLFDDVPSIEKLGRDSRYFPYRYGQAVWSYIAAKWGDAVIAPLLNSVINLGFYKGFTNILGTPLDTISNEWRKSLKSAFAPDLKIRSLPGRIGKRIVDGSDMNLSPEISPDGKLIAFLSTRGLFGIDLYIANIDTGKIIFHLAAGKSDQYFDALKFINSAGTWSPDQKQFAFVVYSHGDNGIALLDVTKKKIIRSFRLEGIDEITQITWSPNGNDLAISGTSGGICNLYVYNFKSGSTRQLTNDSYSELQPAWSPDGEKLAFITDKCPGSNFDSLSFAPMHIGIFNFNNDSIFYLGISKWAKHINPKFSPDGKNLYLISNPDGFDDLYRYSFETDSFYRITKIATGVSGLTELSPAMSVSSKSGKIVFNVFEKAGYKIQMLEPSQARGEDFCICKEDYDANINLAPNLPGGSIVNYYLSKTSSDSVSSNGSFSFNSYKPKLKLLYIGQLYAGIGSDPLGIGINGGISMLFSDLLGNNLLGVGSQLNGNIKDFGGETYYYRLDHRLNWGILASRIPYLYTETESSTDTAIVNGQPTEVQKYTYTDERTYENNLGIASTYPLSTNRRFEMGAGFARINYDYEAEDVVVLNDHVLDRKKYSPGTPGALNLFRSNLSYVGDFSYFGFTSPVEGRRFRFEIEPNIGSLYFIAAQVDYRHYLFVKPLTFAFRLFHYGRYFKDCEDDRLSPLFVGYETLVRGYSYGSFDLSSSTSDNYDNYPEFKRLLGSRIGVFNTEIRLPVLGSGQFGLVSFPYLPTEVSLFFDGGAAWNSHDMPKAFIASNTDKRIPVFSTGGAARFNILGFLVLQMYLAYAFQRTDKNWNWGFVLDPGW